MNIFLVGQKWLLREVRRALLASGHSIIGVCAPPGDKLHEPLLWPLSGANVPACDLIIAAHAHQYIAADIRARARYGCLAYHPSLLPRHKGRDAIEWAIRFGDAITGGTAYWMSDNVDDGEIAAQDWCFILPGEDAASLWRRSLGPLGVDLIMRTVAALARGDRLSRPTIRCAATWEPALAREKLRH